MVVFHPLLMFDLVSHRRTSHSYLIDAIFGFSYGARTRRHGEGADSHTGTRMHKHAHTHRHAWFPQLGTILLLKFTSTLID